MNDFSSPGLKRPGRHPVGVDDGQSGAHSDDLLGVVRGEGVVCGDQDPIVELGMELEEELRIGAPAEAECGHAGGVAATVGELGCEPLVEVLVYDDDSR